MNAATTAKKNVANKARNKNNAYAHWVDPTSGWEYWLLKSWQGDNSEPLARWHVLVKGYETEMGDAYCADLARGLRRSVPEQIDFDATVWGSAVEFRAWALGR